MIQIAQAAPDDVFVIQKLLQITWKDTYGDHLSPATLGEVYKKWQNVEFLTKQIKNSQMYFPLARKYKKVVGLATAWKPADTIILFRLFVYPQHQHQGIGTTLLNDVIAHFPFSTSIRLYVDAADQSARSFYDKQGFREINKELEIIARQTVEQVLLEKAL